MGRYVDFNDCAARYSSLTKDKGAEALDPVIQDAEGECDARLAPRYTVPFVPGSASVPQIVRTLAIDLTYYRCNFQQKWAKDLKRYIDDRFASLLAGSMTLVTSAGALAVIDIAAWSSTPYRSSFGPDGAENYSVSCEWQRVVQDERNGD